jgi:hypothetical protein
LDGGLAPDVEGDADANVDGPESDTGSATEEIPRFVNDLSGTDDSSLSESEEEEERPGELVPDADPTGWNRPRVDPGPSEHVPVQLRNRQRIQVREGVLGGGPHTALSVFQAFFTGELMARFIDRTNRRAAMARLPLSMPDLVKWLALLINMGIKQLPSSRHHWTRDSFGV